MANTPSPMHGQHNIVNTVLNENSASTGEKVIDDDTQATTDAVLIDLSDAVNERNVEDGK